MSQRYFFHRLTFTFRLKARKLKKGGRKILHKNNKTLSQNVVAFNAPRF